MKNLLEKAGFVFWGDEHWGPGEGEIDWANDYTDEFKVFTKLLLEHIEKTCQYVQDTEVVINGSDEYNHGRKMGAEVLKNHLLKTLSN